ncbi:hypothetical protein JQX13_06915 [Archangium violaceum]|uniref:hypothetical protein n=1 Tax=Archangium violaceum TaxID=83451 RepID=UPI00193BD2E0|nr:hypothetical protein [Archangium violaceum]QRK09834.1 hypothetical protein JQX13_06915 [Archangium violaceum]
MLQKNAAAELLPPLSQDVQNIWASLWASEGSLSSANTWDDSFLSCGPFQQTAGTESGKGELAGALDYVKNHESGKELFRKYFLDHKIDVAEVSGKQWMKTGYLMFDGEVLKSQEGKKLLRNFAFPCRFVKAMQEQAFSKLFLEQGFKRLQIVRDMDYDFGEGQKFKLPQIHKSELAQALLLDLHLNRPGFLEAGAFWPELGAGVWAEAAKQVLGKLEKNALGSKGFTLSVITPEHEFEMIKVILELRKKRLKKVGGMTSPEKRAAFIMLCVSNLDDDVAKACGYAGVREILEHTGEKATASNYRYNFLGRPAIRKIEKKPVPSSAHEGAPASGAP